MVCEDACHVRIRPAMCRLACPHFAVFGAHFDRETALAAARPEFPRMRPRSAAVCGLPGAPLADSMGVTRRWFGMTKGMRDVACNYQG
jgi:hypothetical protein